MYGYICGKLAEKHEDYLIVENNGMGYYINSALSTLEKVSLNDDVKMYTHLYVREDAITLYGFLSRDELNMFRLLLSVSGVGPKAAVSMLSSVEPSRFGLAVISEDINILSRAQGIGKKMSQKIILELKDKIGPTQFSSADENKREGAKEKGIIPEAVSALIVLGYTAMEANKAVNAVYSEGAELENVVRNALKALAKGV